MPEHYVFLSFLTSKGEDGWTIIITQDLCVKNLVLEYVKDKTRK